MCAWRGFYGILNTFPSFRFEQFVHLTVDDGWSRLWENLENNVLRDKLWLLNDLDCFKFITDKLNVQFMPFIRAFPVILSNFCNFIKSLIIILFVEIIKNFALLPGLGLMQHRCRHNMYDHNRKLFLKRSKGLKPL